MDSSTPLPLALAILTIYLSYRFTVYLSGLKKVSNLPGLRCAFGPVTPFGASLPTCWWNPGLNWMWRWRNIVYPRYGVDTISIVSFLAGKPVVCTRSLEVARQIVSPKGTDWIKGEEISAPVTEYGPNLFSVEGDEWKKQRRIVNPAFSPATYMLVWDAASEVYDEMVSTEGWTSRKEMVVSNIQEITMKFALVIISRCGFGTPLQWDFTKSAAQDGMSFAQALGIVAENHILRLMVPRWAYKLPIKKFQDLEHAYVTIGKFMSNLIKTRRESLNGGAKVENTSDVFTLMFKASEDEGKLGMNDRELAGNTFLMLFAGHDTTAHTLRATLGLLGAYQDVQEEVYQQIIKIAPKVSDMTFDSSAEFTKVRAAFLEAARLFPPVQMMLRDVINPSILHGVGPDGNEQLPVTPGIRLVADVVGINYHPENYPEPEAVKLDRWNNCSENDMTMFSFGPRSCIGRRFALTEATSFLARLLRDWRVDIILEKGETREQWRQRSMTAKAFITMRVDDFPIRLVRRQ